MTVSRRHGNHIQSALDQSADMGQDSFPVQFAESVARRRHCRAAQQPEIGIPRRLKLGVALLRYALHIAHREKSMEAILVIDDQ